jgi:hypothetical protein
VGAEEVEEEEARDDDAVKGRTIGDARNERRGTLAGNVETEESEAQSTSATSANAGCICAKGFRSSKPKAGGGP